MTYDLTTYSSHSLVRDTYSYISYTCVLVLLWCILCQKTLFFLPLTFFFYSRSPPRTATTYIHHHHTLYTSTHTYYHHYSPTIMIEAICHFWSLPTPFIPHFCHFPLFKALFWLTLFINTAIHTDIHLHSSTIHFYHVTTSFIHREHPHLRAPTRREPAWRAPAWRAPAFIRC